MDRVLIDGQATFSATFYTGGVATDPVPDSATVTITRADGTAIVTDAAATPVPSSPTVPVGTFSYDLAAVLNDRLDRLSLRWTSALGTVVTRAEVAGGFLVPLADLQAAYPSESPARLARWRTAVEQKLEGACGRAFVPRYERQAVTVNRRGRAKLWWGDVRLLRSVAATNAGNTYTYSASQLLALDVDWEAGAVYGLGASWTHGNTTVEYEHGADYPDGDVMEATLAAVAEEYGPNRTDGRIIRKEVDNVAVTFASPSGSRLKFNDADVVAFIRDRRRPLVA